MIRIHIQNLYIDATITCKHKLQITLLHQQPQPLKGNQPSKNIKEILQTKWSLGSTPHTGTVSTRILIKPLVKESQPKASFATVAGWVLLLDPNDHLGFQEACSLGRRRDCRGLKRLPVGGRLP